MNARVSSIPVVVASLLAAGIAQAQPRDPAAAETLYKEGRQLVAAGDWVAGCSKFDASMALDPAASTLLNIARCHERDGKLATAWADYKRALVLDQETPGAERQKTLGEIAEKGIAALEPRLPRMKIVVRNPPPGLVITRNGAPYPAAALGATVPADPGAQEVVASAPGFMKASRSVMLEEGKFAEVELSLAPEIVPPPPTPPPVVAPAPAPAVPAPEPRGDLEHAPRSGGVPAWSFAVGGLGIVLVGVGVALRLDGAAAERALDHQCGTARVCDPKGGYDPSADNARKNRDFGLFVGLGVAGAVALGAAVIGVVSAGPRKSSTALSAAPWIGSSAGGASIRGEF